MDTEDEERATDQTGERSPGESGDPPSSAVDDNSAAALESEIGAQGDEGELDPNDLRDTEALAPGAVSSDQGTAGAGGADAADTPPHATTVPDGGLETVVGKDVGQAITASLALVGVSPACAEATLGGAVASGVLCVLTWLLASRLCCGRSTAAVKRGAAADGGNAAAADATGTGTTADAQALEKEKAKARNMERALQEAEAKVQSVERDKQSAQREAAALKKKLEAQEAAAGQPQVAAAAAAAASETTAASEATAASTQVLEAKLAEVTGERDRYLQEWQNWYQSYATLEQQHQAELAQRDEALAEAKRSSAEAAPAPAPAPAADKDELEMLRTTLQAREAELTDLRSRLGTLTPDAEERKEQLEQERARSAKLLSRCEQLGAQLEAAKTEAQAAELEAERLRAAVAGLKETVAAKEEQGQLQREGGAASGLAAAERSELEQRLRSAEEQVRIVDKGHRDFLAYHNKQMSEKDRKLEISKELMEDRDQKREAQMQELRTRWVLKVEGGGDMALRHDMTSS